MGRGAEPHPVVWAGLGGEHRSRGVREELMGPGARALPSVLAVRHPRAPRASTAPHPRTHGAVKGPCVEHQPRVGKEPSWTHGDVPWLPFPCVFFINTVLPVTGGVSRGTGAVLDAHRPLRAGPGCSC